jgi:hypothetical protein
LVRPPVAAFFDPLLIIIYYYYYYYGTNNSVNTELIVKPTDGHLVVDFRNFNTCKFIKGLNRCFVKAAADVKQVISCTL